MASSVLTLEHFKECLLTYGTDTSRWLGIKQDDITQFLADNAEARELFAEYAPVDALMREGEDDKAPEGLMDRIMQAIDKK